MLYKNKNYAFKTLPDFQDGDIIDGGNYSQSTVNDISADLIIRNNPNMLNCNLTGNITAESNYLKVKKDFCYWLNPELNLPVEVENCRHVVDSNVIETDEGTLTDYIREDTII